MRVDAHVHVWQSSPHFPDPRATIVSPMSEVPLELLRNYMDEHGVDRAVLVQPVYPGEDNALVANCAAAEPDRFVAVCVVDPRGPEAPDRLEYWARVRGCRGLRLRPVLEGEGEVFGAPSADSLWERARDLKLVVNVLARPKHLKTLDALAERYPEVTIIVDHLAHPPADEGLKSPAMKALLDLARRPNVHVKPTGYYYYSREGYPYSDCDALFRAVYAVYGPKRLIWGSDFPHVLLKTGYGRTLKHYEKRYDYLSAEALDLILGGNASRLYWAAAAGNPKSESRNPK